MLCILSVFIPTFIMQRAGPLAVHAADAGGRLRDDRLIPAVQHAGARACRLADAARAARRGHKRGSSIASCRASSGSCATTVRHRWIVVPAYLAACGLLLWLVGRQVGTELFPQVDSGQFVLRFRAPPGSEYELTRKCALKILDVIDRQSEGKGGDLDGLRRPGRDQHGDQQHPVVHAGHGRRRCSACGLQEHSGVAIAELRERLRKALPERGRTVAEAEAPAAGGNSPEEAEARAQAVLAGLRAGRHRQHGDELRLARRPSRWWSSGPSASAVRQHAPKVLAEMKKIPSLRDVQLYQQLDYPTVRVDIDRQKAGLSGVTVKDVTDALLVGTSSSRYVAKNYWRDPKSGVDYQVQVQVPIQRMNRPQQVETLPIRKVSPESNLMVRDVATVQHRHHAGRDRPQRHAALPEHHGQRRGRATWAGRRRRSTAPSPTAGEPPRGVRVDRPRPGRADERDVPLLDRRPGARRWS